MSFFHLFPYELVEKGSRIIIYGAGEVGRSFVEQINANHYCEIIAIVDRNYEKIEPIYNIKVISPSEIGLYSFDKIVVAVMHAKQEIISSLYSFLMDRNKIICADYPFYPLEKIEPPVETVEAIVVKNVFDMIGIEKPSYIDVGACHPHMSSNTMLFYVNGSRGINIEPNIELKEEFLLYRPEDINLFIGVATQSGEGKFYKCNNPYLSTFLNETMQYSIHNWQVEYEEEYKIVPLMTLNQIVNRYNDGIFMDFLDIDIEGMDIEVLKHCDFSKSSPKVICAEGNIVDLNEVLGKKECENGGYIPYYRCFSTVIYLRKDIYQKVMEIEV